MLIMSTEWWNEIRYFKMKELACRHCARVRMVEEFMRRLDELRSRLGHPLWVTSGYRCPEHNSRVSSTGKTGPHTTGRAADLAVHGAVALNVVVLAGKLGFTGIGVRQHGPHHSRFIHLDDIPPSGTYPRPAMWSYP